MNVGTLLVFVLVAGVLLLGRVVSRKLGLPDAVLFVVLGLLVAAAPFLPNVRLDPEVALYGFLPPLIFHAAFLTSPRETKENAGPITGLAIGLVVATAVAVAAVVHALVAGMSWPVAFALGAVLGPTDPVAATSVLARFGVPKQITTILEGEGLVNDGIALTIFGLALEAEEHGFTVGHGLLRLVEVVAGGLAYGCVLGFVVARVRPLLRDDANSQILLTLVLPFLAYVPAEELHSSGVLAVVALAWWLSFREGGLFQPTSRLQGIAVWSLINFIIESALFVLIGLQVPRIIDGVRSYGAGELAALSAASVAVVVGLRIVWELAVPPLVARIRRDEVTTMPLRWRGGIAACGLRGGISLAIALSIPVSTSKGNAFPYLTLVLFLTVVVVVTTLVGGALVLPFVLRLLHIDKPAEEQQEEQQARRAMAQAALDRLEQAIEHGEVAGPGAEGLRDFFHRRLDNADADDGSDEAAERANTYAQLRRELVGVERETLRRLYRERTIGADTRREMNRLLDLEEARMQPLVT